MMDGSDMDIAGGVGERERSEARREVKKARFVKGS